MILHCNKWYNITTNLKKQSESMNILFDLDGTLTDSSEGITKSIQYALQELGKPVPSREKLLLCIGPPLLTSFLGKLGMKTETEAKKAVSLYRKRYAKKKGHIENRVYDNIFATLDDLKQQGHSLFVATAKPQVQARPILQHLQLAPYFKKIYGSELDGKNQQKTDLIATILRKENLPANNTIMVGDREYDMRGARNNKVLPIGVSYGFGSINELKASGAAYLAQEPLQIASIVRSIMK